MTGERGRRAVGDQQNKKNLTVSLAAACAKCGACTAVCPVYQITGRESLTARGRLHLIGRLTDAQQGSNYGDILSKCLLCGACEDVCPRGIKTTELFIAARCEFSAVSGPSFLKYISRKALAHPALLTGLAATSTITNRLLANHLPADSGLRLRLAALEPGDFGRPPTSYLNSVEKPAARTPPGTPNTAYFIGCLANHLQPEIAAATVQLLRHTGDAEPLIPGQQSCCGLPALAAGDLDEARRLAQKNIAAFDTTESSAPILTSCGSCYAHLSCYPALFSKEPEWHQRALAFQKRVREFSTFFDNRLPARLDAFSPPGRTQNVFYHDPCHLRFGHKITEPPRKLIDRLPDVRRVELAGGPQCCGQGGLFHVGHPQLSKAIHNRLQDKLAELQVQTVVTTCSGCLLQWQQGVKRLGLTTRVRHLAILLLEALRKGKAK